MSDGAPNGSVTAYRARVSETWAERVVAALRAAGTPLDDDRLAFRVGASQRQTINQACRKLESEGVVRRFSGPDGKIVNALVDPSRPERRDPSPAPPADVTRGALLTEDEVKAAVKGHLEGGGWQVTVAWGRNRGVDIEAHRGSEHLYLEAKGEAANPPQQVNYFLGALGELVQRLRDPTARYGLALPANSQYRGLVERLPPLAWERLRLMVFLVDPADRRTVTTIPT